MIPAQDPTHFFVGKRAEPHWGSSLFFPLSSLFSSLVSPHSLSCILGCISEASEKHLGNIWETFGETWLAGVHTRGKTMEE